MIVKFYRNNSDERCLNKDLTELTLGSRQVRVDTSTLLPYLTAASPDVTCSSEAAGYPAWAAFNSTINTSWNSPGDPPTSNTCWAADPSDNAPWIQYELDDACYFTEVRIISGSDYMGDWVGVMTVELSANGISWDIVYSDTITVPVNTATTFTYPVNSDTAYKYIKVSYDRPITVPYGISNIITSIQASGYYYTMAPFDQLDVEFKQDESRLNPSLILQHNVNVEGANYCSINSRYYYITDVTYSQQRIILSLHEDVLMSHASDILKLGVIVDRQTYEGNPYLKDSEMPVEAKRNVQVKIFPYGFSGDTYILATNGV